MNHPTQVTGRLIPAAAAAAITLGLFAAIVSLGEPQRSQTIAGGLLARQAEVVAKSRQPAPAQAVAGSESPKSVATLAVALADESPARR